MSQIQYSDVYRLVSNVPTEPLSKANERLFHALTAVDENSGYELAKAIHVPPQKTFPIPSARAPFATSENIVLGERSSGGLKRVKTITKTAGNTIRQRRRKEKENLAIAFFANGF